ncbi:MAG: PKD domain-containing protein, partial [Euryarchaeota archaeon]|nr:PKD domain-containing protein [Euryarchaeota archaeon]
IFGHSVSLSGDTALIGARFDETYSGSAYVFTASGTTWTQQQKLTASDPGVDDSFGISVSLKGDTALIGAMDEISGDNSGAAYVFTRTGTTWTQQAKLLPSDGAPGDWFGGRVSLFDDTALIGAAWDDDNGYNSGSAYIFTKEGVNQPPIANFTYTPENPTTTDIIQFTDTSTDNDGTIASWHWDFSDGNISTVQNPTYSYTTAGTYPITLFVTDDDGATDSIEKTIIVIETGPSVNWTEIQKLLPSDITENDEFGRSPSIDGNTAFIGAPGFTDGTKKGSVYVFTRTDNTWTQQQKILASDGASGDHFGFSISLKGNTALIGAINGQGVAVNSGSTYVFTCSGGTWTQQAKLIAPDGGTGDMFGMWVSLDEDTALIGAPHNGGGIGAAYVLTRTGTTWTQQQKLTASDGSPGDVFGASASLDGDTAALGAYYADGIVSTTGCMYIFVRTGTTWTQQQKLFASDGSSGDVFGHSVCVDGNTAIAGARFDENYYGSEYVFIRIGTTWTQQQKLTAQDGGAHDSFGEFAALDGDTALIGASDEIYGGSGAAYVFTRSGTTWTPQARLLPSDGVDGDFFSLGVALNGDTIFIGAPYKNDLSGSAYIFTKEGVNQQPASNFTYTPENPTISDTIIFTDTSYDPDGTITSWLWDFGDGNNSVIQNPTYQYTTIGEFSIVLTITDNDGATANITRLLTVTIAGDLDHDDDVDEDDFWVFVAAFGRSIGDPLYNPEADYNHNGVIDLVDYQIWLQYYRAFNNISTDGPDFEEEPLDEFYQDQISIDQQQSLDMNTSTQNMSSPNKISKLHDLQNISNIEIEIEIPHDSFDPIAGDLDHDGDVDNDDFTLLAQAFNHSTGDTLYDPEGDYDYDGTITYIDYQIWLGYYRDFNELM